MTDWSPPAGLARVISGVGSVRERLAATLRELGVRRPMIVCGRNIAATPLIAAVREAAGIDCALFDGSLEHTPVEAVEAGIAAVRAARPDALIALGGSSAIDCAKAIAVAIKLDLATVRDLPTISFSTTLADGAGPAERMKLICIPTTLSGAEFYALIGIRDPGARHKQPYAEQGLVSRTVFLDGEIAATTPRDLWIQTGAKSLDDCLMRFCVSADGEPAWDAVHVTAIRGLLVGLGAGDDAEARQKDFFHLWLPTCPVPRLTPFAYRGWLSIAVRHSLGGMIGFPHGMGSCVAMVEALRFHAPATAARQAVLAELLGGEGRPLTAIVSDWRERVGLPASLRELGIEPGLAGELAASVVKESPAIGAEAEVKAACERLW